MRQMVDVDIETYRTTDNIIPAHILKMEKTSGLKTGAQQCIFKNRYKSVKEKHLYKTCHPFDESVKMW